MRIVAIVQARMGSTRLPGKVLRKISGKSVLEHVINRLKLSKKINNIVVATTFSRIDRPIAKLAAELGLNLVRGSENDVLSRYMEAANRFQPDIIVRITADCPLIDPELADLVIEKHINDMADYTSSTLVHTYPRGLDVEVCTYGALKKAFDEAILPEEREHVTLYLYRHPELFKLSCLEATGRHRRPDIRICVDTKEDLHLVRMIFRKLSKKSKLFFTDEIIRLFESDPELVKINMMVKQRAVK